MLRTIFWLFAIVILITVIRMVAGVLTKGVAQLFSPTTPTPPQPHAGGELKQDPVCGTYVSADAAVKKTVHGEVVYFCSAACRDKHKVPAS